jgi:hypothetical protein
VTHTPPTLPPFASRHSKFVCEPYGAVSRSPEEWLVKPLLPRQGVGFLAGASGAGKSFLALDWALRIAAGMDVLGYRTKTAGVVYVAAEAPNGVRKRVEAWRTRHAAPSAAFEMIGQAPDLRDADDLADLQATLQEAATRLAGEGWPLGVVFLDTLAASMPGGSENEGKDMSLLIAAVQEIAASLGVLVVIITHTGKDESRGIRGWSGQFAAADVVVMLGRDPEDRDLRIGTVAKQKEAEDGGAFAFRLDQVSLGVDSDGDEVTSAVPVYVPPPPSGARAKRSPPLNDRAKLVLQALNYLFDHGATVPAPPVPGREAGGPAVTREALRSRALDMGLYEGASPAAGRQRFYDALEKLKAANLIRVERDFVWPLRKGTEEG